MANGFTDPSEFLKAPSDRPRELNFGKRSAYAAAQYQAKLDAKERDREQDEKWTPLTPGDPDDRIKQYAPSAQTSSAHAEKAAHDAKERARRTLDEMGHLLDPKARKQLEHIAATGQAVEKTNKFMSFLDLIDTPREIISLTLADVFGVDQNVGGEITFGDYWDTLISNQAGIEARHADNPEFVKALGLDQDFAVEGQQLLDAAGLFEHGNEDEGEGFLEKLGQTALGFTADVLLDPLTYVTFGTAGVGRKAAIEATTGAAIGTSKGGAKKGWKGAITHMLEGGAVDELDDIARHAGTQIEERIAREIADQTAAFTDEFVALKGRAHKGQILPRERAEIAEAAREHILRQELRAVEIVEGADLSKAAGLVEDLGKLGDDVVFGTAFEREVSQMAKLQVNKQYKTFAEQFGVYVRSKDMPEFAKGGLGLALPFHRRSMPIAHIGPRFNGPGQKVMSRVLDKLPVDSQAWLRNQGEKFSPTRQFYNRAKDYDAAQADKVSGYFVEATTANHLQKSDAGVRLQGVSDELRKTVEGIRATAARAGMEASQADDIVRRLMGNVDGALDDVTDQTVRNELEEAAAGIAGTLQSIHAAAQEVGMKLGHVEDYVPLITDPTYRKELAKLAEDGRAVLFEGVADAETRLGLELLSESVATQRGAGRAVRRLGESAHAKSRLRSAKFDAPEITLLDRTKLDDALAAAGVSYYDHDALNRAVTKGLEVLRDQGKIDPKALLKLDGRPFETDLVKVLDIYMGSMTNAIQLRDAARIFRKAGKIVDKAERVSITRTLKHVNDAVNSAEHPIMRFLDDVALSTEEGAAFHVGAKASAKETVTIAKGWDMEVPAALLGTEAFERIRGRLGAVYERVGRNVRNAEAVVHQHMDRLVSEGVPPEVAARVSLVEADTEFAELVGELRRLGDDQAAELQILAAEQVSMNAHKIDARVAREQLDRAAVEAEQIRKGVDEAIGQHEDNLARQLKIQVTDRKADRVVDLSDANGPDGRPFNIWLADETQAFLDANEIARWQPLEDMSEEAIASATAHPELAARAAEDLIDRVEMVDLTIGDLVEFSDPSRAAATLDVLARRLDDAGLPSDEVLSPEIRAALADVNDANEYLKDVRAGIFDELDGQGFREGSVKEAKEQVVIARANLIEQAESLIGSEVRLGDHLSRVEVTDLIEDELFSTRFLDVWAASMWNLDNMDHKSFASELRANRTFAEGARADAAERARKAVAEGKTPKVRQPRETGRKTQGQKGLYQNNSKKVVRAASVTAISGWHEAVQHALDLKNVASLNTFEPHPFTKAIRALRSNDRVMIAKYEPEIQEMMRRVMPTLDASVQVRPSGAIVLTHQVDEPVWATLDEILPQLREVVEGGADMSTPQLVGTAIEAWRFAPEAMEEASPELGRFFRALDSQGGFDFDMETYEYLRSFSDELKVFGLQSRKEADRLGKQAGKVSKANQRALDAAAALDTVLDHVDRAARGGAGVGDKKLTQVYEKNIAAITAGLPAQEVDKIRSLVEYTIAVRHVKLPKRVLDKQIALRRHLWEPLDEGIARFEQDVIGLMDEAAATGNAELEEAAGLMRSFQEKLAALNSQSNGPNLVTEGSQFVDDLRELKSVGDEAIDAVTKLDEEFLYGIPGGPRPGQSIENWARQTQKRINSWEPQTVNVHVDDNFVDLQLGGVAGDIFEDAIADRHVARILENMAGNIAAVNTPLGLKQLAGNMREIEKWWRAAATVARPTFVPRNIIGGVFNGMVIGVGVPHYAFAAKHIVPPVHRIRKGMSTWADEIAAASPKAKGYLIGVRDSEVLASSFAASSLDHLTESVRGLQRINPLNSGNELFYRGGQIMEKSEDLLRAAAFVAHYNPAAPGTGRMAKALTMAVHFDYTDLTPLERQFKKIAPFFTWTRNNIPLQLRTMFEKPGLIAKYRHLVANIDHTYGEDNPYDEFGGNKYRSGLAANLGGMFNLGEGSAFWATPVFDPDLPWKDIEELAKAASDGPGGLADWAFGSLSPLYSAPMDVVSGESYDVNAPIGLAQIVKLAGAVIPGYDPTVAMDGSVRISNKAANLFNTALPMAREFSDFAGVVPSSPNSSARLGYTVADGVDAGERGRAIGLRALRAAGLNFDTPSDAAGVAKDAFYNQIPDIIDAARFTGQAINPDDLDQVIDYILSSQGIPTD